jgi:hypothetical protein
MWGCELHSTGLGEGPVAGSSGSIEREEFIDRLSDSQILRRKSAPWIEFVSYRRLLISSQSVEDGLDAWSCSLQMRVQTN